MANAQRAYQYPEIQPSRTPRVRVVPGQGTSPARNTLSPSVMFFARALVVVVVVFTLLGFVRIGLASATVNAALSADGLSTSIESARSAGSELEVRQSYLSNSTNVKTSAAKLGMKEPEATVSVTLEKDIVTTDAAGNLSLALSLAAVPQG